MSTPPLPMPSLTASVRLSALPLFLALATFSAGETLTTTDGHTLNGKIGGVYGPVVLVTGKTSSTLVAVDKLDDASLDLVAGRLAVTTPAPTSWDDSKSPVAQSLRGKLTRLADGKILDYVPSGPEPEFYLIYYSAHWCGPCRRFTPSLVDHYNRLKQGPDGSRFELVFVSSDRDASEQQKYIASAGMPWPAIKYSQLGKAKPVEKWKGNGIPCLVVLNREGDMLYHSYRGSEYLGPKAPLDAFTTLLSTLDPRNPMTRKARYRLAVREWIKAASTTDAEARAYLRRATDNRATTRPLYRQPGDCGTRQR